jgi:hypothetical protein
VVLPYSIHLYHVGPQHLNVLSPALDSILALIKVYNTYYLYAIPRGREGEGREGKGRGGEVMVPGSHLILTLFDNSFIPMCFSVNHSCHNEDVCPPCTVLTKRMCSGNHEVSHSIIFSVKVF